MKITSKLTTISQSTHSTNLTIEGITEPVVLRYFESMNAGEYEITAALFAETGAMYPPFEDAIVGKETIATYLKAEAKGMHLSPREGISRILENKQTQILVTGKVQTPLFGVNISWIFVLSREQEIMSATIKLLASPQELLNLQKKQLESHAD
ncbi:MAG: nuclear transport factor 2 family protein [Symploca sp. SIO2E9]|nr:nuclear transport factor 2 family protein [Symploca sp. SIO2E9]